MLKLFGNRARRALVWSLVLVFALSLLTGCGGGKKEPEVKKEPVPGVTDTEITFGSFMALSGPVAAVGVPVRKGLEAYLNYINEQGGVDGRKIKVIIEDDAFDPAKSLAAVKKLVEQDKVLAIAPALGTPGVLATLDYYEENKVPLIYPMTGVAQPAHPAKKYVFTIQPNYLDEARVLVKYAAENLSAKKIAVLYQNSDIGKQGLEGVKEQLKVNTGAALVYEGAFEAKDVDFSTQVLNAKKAEADTVIIYTVVVQAAGILKEAQKQGLKANFMTTYVNADLNLFKLAGEAANGVILTGWVPIPSPDDANFKKFLEIYQKYNPGETPSGFSTAGFIAGEIIVEAVKRAGQDLDREKLVAALETFNNFTGIQAQAITYGPVQRSGVTSLYMLKTENNTFVPLSKDRINLK